MHLGQAVFYNVFLHLVRYENALEKGRWMAMKKYYCLAVGLGIVFFVTYASYGLAFWYGSQLIGAGVVTPGSVFTVSI